MVSNVVLRHGTRGEVRLDKDEAGDKIDGVAALAMALTRALVNPVPTSVYESRGVVAL
jgi:phage terminase large subunit-like protein